MCSAMPPCHEARSMVSMIENSEQHPDANGCFQVAVYLGDKETERMVAISAVNHIRRLL